MYYKDDGSIDYVELANDLTSMIHGYPNGDPDATLEEIALDLKADPGSRHGRAMLAAVWASRWYIKWQVSDLALFDDLIGAAVRAGDVLKASGCTAAGRHEHPQIDGDDPEEAASVVALIGDPEAWLASDPFLTADPDDALACPAFLAPLAEETAEALQDARKDRFES